MLTGAAALVHPSLTLAVHVCVLAQAGPVGPAVVTIIFALMSPSQLSEAVNVGAVTVGLHPRSPLVAVVLITGNTRSSFQVYVILTGAAALVHPSLTLAVHVCVLAHAGPVGPAVVTIIFALM